MGASLHIKYHGKQSGASRKLCCRE